MFLMSSKQGIILPRSPLKFTRVDFHASIHVGRLLVPKKQRFFVPFKPWLFKHLQNRFGVFSFGLFFGIQTYLTLVKRYRGGRCYVPCKPTPFGPLFVAVRQILGTSSLLSFLDGKMRIGGHVVADVSLEYTP